jgi:hypothetical protein
LKNKFNIGDRVINSATSLAPIQIGVITAVLCPENYKKNTRVVTSFEGWDNLFPNWMKKPVYFVELDYASTIVASGVSSHPDAFKKHPRLAFVEDDLKLFASKSEPV